MTNIPSYLLGYLVRAQEAVVLYTRVTGRAVNEPGAIPHPDQFARIPEAHYKIVSLYLHGNSLRFCFNNGAQVDIDCSPIGECGFSFSGGALMTFAHSMGEDSIALSTCCEFMRGLEENGYIYNCLSEELKSRGFIVYSANRYGLESLLKHLAECCAEER